uniref:Peptidase S1 domain-containing protein n=1 Tax=Castor canadensis TaxID=51338 RepID=A0A8C0W2S1_CASCN
MKALKSLPSSQLTTWLTIDTSGTTWFLVLTLSAGAVPHTQSRIMEGWECMKNSQPWQVVVVHKNKYGCRGVLVYPQWVLMAVNYQLWLGHPNIFGNQDRGQKFKTSSSFPHTQFNMSLLKNPNPIVGKDPSHDLMLLCLTQPVQITEAVKPVNLPPAGAASNQTGTECVSVSRTPSRPGLSEKG